MIGKDKELEHKDIMNEKGNQNEKGNMILGKVEQKDIVNSFSKQKDQAEISTKIEVTGNTTGLEKGQTGTKKKRRRNKKGKKIV